MAEATPNRRGKQKSDDESFHPSGKLPESAPSVQSVNRTAADFQEKPPSTQRKGGQRENGAGETDLCVDAATAPTEKKVRCRKDLLEAKSWLLPSRSQSPEVILRSVSHELDTHLSVLISDRKRMQSVKFETPSYSPVAVTAFRELKMNNNHKVRELVTVYPGLVFVVDATLQTLLHWACKRGNSDIAIFLIDRGADPDKANLAGRSARQIADKKGLGEVFGYMNIVKPIKKNQPPTRWKSQKR